MGFLRETEGDGRGQGGERFWIFRTGPVHLLATKLLYGVLGVRLLLISCFGEYKEFCHILHSFIHYLGDARDAGDPEMNKAQGSQSKWGESVSENVITVWSGVAARTRTWWTQRVGHSLCGKVSAKVTLVCRTPSCTA